MAKRGRPRHPDVLTPREWEVLALLREGRSNEEIAERLGVSLAGAKYHVSEILGKLGVASREEAAAWQPRERPWWAAAPVALWHRLSGGPLPALAAGAVTLAVVAGAGLLAWGLVRTGGEGDDTSGVRGPLSPPVSIGTATPDTNSGSNEATLHLLDLETGAVQRLATMGDLSPDGRLLATSSPEEPAVHVIDISTGERKRVFDHAVGSISWSPDSSQLVIAGRRSEDPARSVEEGVFVVNADGSGLREIVDLDQAFAYWSPTGEWIAVLGRADGAPTPAPASAITDFILGLVRPDGTSGPRVTTSDLDGSPHVPLIWSPSGRRLLFYRELLDGGTELAVLDVQSAVVRSLVSAEFFADRWPTDEILWSPDSTQVAIATFDTSARPSSVSAGAAYDTFTVYIAPSDGSGPPQALANGRYPSWSADGNFLTFVSRWCQSDSLDGFGVGVWDKASGLIEEIAPPDLIVIWAGFSPSQALIAFHAIGDNPAIYTIRPDGNAMTRVLDGTPFDDPEWAPDGQMLTFLAPGGGHGICD